MSRVSHPHVNVRSLHPREGTITGVLLGFAIAMAGCSSVSSSDPETPARQEVPALRQAGVVVRPATEADLPAARIVPIAAACKGEHLTLDAELSACACSDRKHAIYDGKLTVSAGAWCGLPHSNETTRADIRVTAERTELAPGEGTRAILRLTNSGPETSVYRFPTRHLTATLVQADGRPLPAHQAGNGPYNDEALFELPPNGTMELRIPVTGNAPKLSPGAYAIQVFLGGVGGEASRLVPIRVR